MNFKVLFSAVVMFCFVIFVLSGLNPSSAKENTELSWETELFTIFDPNFQYLDDGAGYISYPGDYKVSIWGQTLGTRLMDKIGVQLTLQRWNGSEWIDVNTGANVTETNSSYAYSSRDIDVLQGYYYRVKSKHWIVYNNASEEGVRYSNSILIN